MNYIYTKVVYSRPPSSTTQMYIPVKIQTKKNKNYSLSKDECILSVCALHTCILPYIFCLLNNTKMCVVAGFAFAYYYLISSEINTSTSMQCIYNIRLLTAI